MDGAGGGIRLISSDSVRSVPRYALVADSRAVLCCIFHDMPWALLYGLLYDNISGQWRIYIAFSYTSAMAWKRLALFFCDDDLYNNLEFLSDILSAISAMFA